MLKPERMRWIMPRMYIIEGGINWKRIQNITKLTSFDSIE